MSGGRNPAILDTLARAYFATGDLVQAVETERRAVALLPPPERGAPGSHLRRELEANLARFEQALARRR